MTIQDVAIIDTTLRKGEQFAQAHFTTAQKQMIVRALDRFGVDAIEITNPPTSPRSFADARLLAALPLRAMILAHVRWTVDDVQAAIDAGVDGVNIFYGMSDQLREHSHGHSLAAMISCAERCIRLAQAHGLVVRFSSLFTAAHRTSPGAASPTRLRPSSPPSLCSGISAHTPKRPAWSTPLKQRSPPVSARPTSAAAQRWLLMSVNQSLLPCKPKHGAFRHHLYIRYDHSAQVIHRFHARRGVIHGSPLCGALPSRGPNE